MNFSSSFFLFTLSLVSNVFSSPAKSGIEDLVTKVWIDQFPKGPVRDRFESNMHSFMKNFERMEDSRTPIDWEAVKSPDSKQILSFDELSSGFLGDMEREKLLGKLAVVKLNGGLGTSMGCKGPKSLIKVRDDLTFLDITVSQIIKLNKNISSKAQQGIPLILMNSFNTFKDTTEALAKYNGLLNIIQFNQSQHPRFSEDKLMPVCEDPVNAPNHCWYPPGHGDLFNAMNADGILDQLLDQGKEYLFISNIDNLGGTIDERILAFLANNNHDFIMEVTNKTLADVKGGTLIEYKGGVRLLELAQVPKEHVKDFESISKFKVFNTNNLWLKISAIKKVLEQVNSQGNLDGPEIIINRKSIPEIADGTIIQLETAVGAWIKMFSQGIGINVPRSRFLPVKTTSDLILLQSDMFEYDQNSGKLFRRPGCTTAPIIKLGERFKKVSDFMERVPHPLKLCKIQKLDVDGNVFFQPGAQLNGSLILNSDGKQRFLVY